MIVIRSVLFNIYFAVLTTVYCACGSCLFFLPRVFHSRTAHWWAFLLIKGTQYILNLRYEVEGMENLPQNANYIIASKHQSAYETILYHVIFRNPAFVLKQELVFLLFYGWQILLTGAIPIDRSSGMVAMKKILNGAKNRLENNQPVIIFPEGTRVKYGERGVYRPGVAFLYNHLPDTPIYPVAINSGKYWGKNAFFKKSGVVKIKILPALPQGLNKKEFMAQLEDKIETGCKDL